MRPCGSGSRLLQRVRRSCCCEPHREKEEDEELEFGNCAAHVYFFQALGRRQPNREACLGWRRSFPWRDHRVSRIQFRRICPRSAQMATIDARKNSERWTHIPGGAAFEGHRESLREPLARSRVLFG